MWWALKFLILLGLGVIQVVDGLPKNSVSDYAAPPWVVDGWGGSSDFSAGWLNRPRTVLVVGC